MLKRLSQDFPQRFVLKPDKNNPHSKTWSLRQRQGFAIGRIYYAGPTAGERFHLRTLLMVVKGAKSFDDLKRGLLEDDGEWRICLEDAAEIQTGSQLRHLFAILLLFCSPANPKAKLFTW